MKVLPGENNRSKNIEDIRAYFGTPSIRNSRGRKDDVEQFVIESFQMAKHNQRPYTNMKYVTNTKFRSK